MAQDPLSVSILAQLDALVANPCIPLLEATKTRLQRLVESGSASVVARDTLLLLQSCHTTEDIMASVPGFIEGMRQTASASTMPWTIHQPTQGTQFTPIEFEDDDGLQRDWEGKTVFFFPPPLFCLGKFP